MEEKLTTKDTVLRYRNVDIFQGEHQVLKDVNLCVQEGEMVYLTGAVGSGKTSLIKTIYGEVECEGAQADVLGFDMLSIEPSELPDLRRQLGIIFQDFQLLQARTVRKNLDFVLRATDWEEKEERIERIRQVLKMVKLEDKMDCPVYKLSGGEQQRICMARSILNNPRIILADEPTGNLDNENGELIMALLDEIRRQHNAAVLISTHNLQWPKYFPGTIYKCKNRYLNKEENDNE